MNLLGDFRGDEASGANDWGIESQELLIAALCEKQCLCGRQSERPKSECESIS